MSVDTPLHHNERLTLDALKILDRGFVEEKAVPLVERVDFAPRRYFDVRMGENELAEALQSPLSIEKMGGIREHSRCPK
jgi:hypothetical protein